MMAALTNQLNAFTKMHDEFIVEWNKTMMTGDTSAVERMDEQYFAVFLNGKPVIFNKEEAVTGMRQSVQQLLGAKKAFSKQNYSSKRLWECCCFL